jgi:YegS/Rv2252/BmrU family lipid kinase
MSESPIAFIVNPASASGKTGEKWPEILSLIQATLKNFKVFVTEKPLQATSLTRQALVDGSSVIVVVGGDGTLSEVVNAFFEHKVNKFPNASLGCIPCGTGGDFRRTVKWDHDIKAAIKRLETMTVKVIDVGHVIFREGDLDCEQYFINISSCGASGLIAKIANDMPKFMGGLITFYSASVYGMIEYQRMALRMKCDEGEWEELKEVNCVAVCNGAYFGGGMKVGPAADIADGLFDVTIWTNYSIFDFVTKASAIYDGSHVEHESTRTFKCRTLEVDLLPSHKDSRSDHLCTLWLFSADVR